MLNCMLLVIRQQIKNETQNAEYFSAISDKMTNVSAQFQMSIIFRCILSNDTSVERFVDSSYLPDTIQNHCLIV